jgi:hypothetical protein
MIATARMLEIQHIKRPQPGLFDRTHAIMNTGKSQVNVGTTRSPRENRSNTNAINSARNENHLGKRRRTEFIVANSSDGERICAALWPHNGAELSSGVLQFFSTRAEFFLNSAKLFGAAN